MPNWYARLIAAGEHLGIDPSITCFGQPTGNLLFDALQMPDVKWVRLMVQQEQITKNIVREQAHHEAIRRAATGIPWHTRLKQLTSDSDPSVALEAKLWCYLLNKQHVEGIDVGAFHMACNPPKLTAETMERWNAFYKPLHKPLHKAKET